MKINTILIIQVFIYVLCGCTMEVNPTAETITKTINCKDTRDGTEFSFKGSSIKNAQTGFFGADTCFEITNDKNNVMILCKSHELFLKCK